MKAFVTGGSGFVGRHMIQMLCDRLEIMTHGNSDRIVYMEDGKLMPNIEVVH